MNTKQRRKYLVGLLAMAAFPAFGGGMDDWRSIAALRPGTRVGVVQANGKRVEGRFESVTDQGIALEDGGLVSISQQDVIRVYTIGRSRSKRMLIGGAIGLGAGAAIAATVARRLNNEGFFAGSNGGAATAATVAGGTGIGLAVGNFTGSGYRTVYQKQGGR